MNTASNINITEEKVPFKQLIAFGVGGIIPIALFNIAGQLMGLIGNISLGLSAFWLGVILIIPRLWDAVSDPIVGHMSDNTRSRWGRRRPYLLIGGIAVAISFVLMWWVPQGEMVRAWFPSEKAFEWFQLGYILLWLLIFFTACTIFEVPHGALGMEMSTDSHERTRLFSAKSFFGNMFAMGTPWLFALANLEYFRGSGGNEIDGMRYVSMIIAAILIPLSVWWFFAVREPNCRTTASQKKTLFWDDMRRATHNKTFLVLVAIIFTLAMGFNFVSLLSYYISIFYLYAGDKAAASALLGINGTIWAITGLLAVFPLNWCSPKLGKRNTLILAIGLMCTAQLTKIVCYNPDYPYLIIIPTMLLSSGMLFFFTLGASMVGDICDEDDLNHGQRAEGSYYSVYWWFIKMGTAFASFVTGILIVFSQFDETQVIRVDKLQRDIHEVHTQIKVFDDYYQTFKKPLQDNATGLDNTQVITYMNTLLTKAVKQSKMQLSQLESESAEIPIYTRDNIDKLNAGLLKLETFKSSTTATEFDALISELQPLLIHSVLEQASTSAIALQAHLHSRHQEDPFNSHTESLWQISEVINRQLIALTQQKNMPLSEMSIDIGTLEKSISSLTLQAPRTLLRLRVIEIGLPLLLCLISLWFAFRYPLNESRCQEIKIKLRARNTKQLSSL